MYKQLTHRHARTHALCLSHGASELVWTGVSCFTSLAIARRLQAMLNFFHHVSFMSHSYHGICSHPSSSTRHSARQWRRSQTGCSLDNARLCHAPSDAWCLWGSIEKGAWPWLVNTLSFHVMTGWSFWGEIPLWLTAQWKNPRPWSTDIHQSFFHSAVLSWSREFTNPFSDFVHQRQIFQDCSCLHLETLTSATAGVAELLPTQSTHNQSHFTLDLQATDHCQQVAYSSLLAVCYSSLLYCRVNQQGRSTA